MPRSAVRAASAWAPLARAARKRSGGVAVGAAAGLVGAGMPRPARWVSPQAHPASHSAMPAPRQTAQASPATSPDEGPSPRRGTFAPMGRYNTQRLQSTLNDATPTEWEALHRTVNQLEQAA